MPVKLNEWPDPKPTLRQYVEPFLDGGIYEFDVADARGFGIIQYDHDNFLNEDVRDRRIMLTFKGSFLGQVRLIIGPWQTRTTWRPDQKHFVFQVTGFRECRFKGCITTAVTQCNGYCPQHKETK